MKKKIFTLYLLIGLSATGCSTLSEKLFQIDDFNIGTLNANTWQITKDGDFKEWAVDVVEGNKEDHCLRLKTDTLGTRDDTVKFIGVRSKEKFDISSTTISFDLDWNNQDNGSYLTAGLYISPEKSKENPEELENWLNIQYVGVLPGKNARCEVLAKTNGKLKVLYWEGWPEKKEGRQISYQRIKVIIDEGALKVIENNIIIFETKSYRLSFRQVYLYFQMSSHSNYPAREVFFDNIAVSATSN